MAGNFFLKRIFGLSLLFLLAGTGWHAVAQPDLRLLSTISSNPVKTGDNFTWSWSVTDEGSIAATGIQLHATLPTDSCDQVALNAGMFSVFGLCSKGSICFGSNCPVVSERCQASTYSIQIGTLPAGGAVSASVVANFFGTGSFPLKSWVTQNETDPTLSNNSNSIALLVEGLPILRTYKRGAWVEFYWNAADNIYHLEATTNLMAPAWDLPAGEVFTSGNYHAIIFTNIFAQAATNNSATYLRLAPSSSPGPFGDLPFEIVP